MSKSLDLDLTEAQATTTTTDKFTLALALRIAKDLRQRQAEYDADVRHWYEHGDGRPTDAGGRGYRYPLCIHGANLWVDHDIPCGWCEEGLSLYDEALMRARELARDYTQRCEVANALLVAAKERDMALPGDLLDAVTAWMSERVTHR